MSDPTSVSQELGLESARVSFVHDSKSVASFLQPHFKNISHVNCQIQIRIWPEHTVCYEPKALHQGGSHPFRVVGI